MEPVFGFILLIILVSFPVAIYLEIRDSKKEVKETDRRLDQELEEEKAKPRWFVYFTINETTLRSKPFEPVRFSDIRVTTSQEEADYSLRESFKRGYFESKDGSLYPASRIKAAWKGTERN